MTDTRARARSHWSKARDRLEGHLLLGGDGWNDSQAIWCNRDEIGGTDRSCRLLVSHVLIELLEECAGGACSGIDPRGSVGCFLQLFGSAQDNLHGSD